VNKKIEKINLNCKLYSIITKDNNITSNEVICLKESFIKNKYLKEINFRGKKIKKNKN
jgi:hypothetical protein